MIRVFDDAQLVRQQSRTFNAPSKSPHFLFDWVIDQLHDRLSLIKRDFSCCVRIGTRGKDYVIGGNKPLVISHTFSSKANVLCHFEFLPLKPMSVDLVTSALELHTVNDLPGCLLQIKNALKPDGLFLSAMLGGETLYELRDCLAQAELEISGGVSPRVAPFADKQQIGALLQRAGFALPVIDSDIITVTYNTVFDLMKDLRRMGEGNAILARKKSFTAKSLFLRAGEIYAQKYAESDGRIRASFEIIFMSGWAPHDSQQKPLPPGSAQHRLSDALGGTEMGTGEKPH